METILHTPGHLPLDRIDVWFQDEARFGQQNQTTRLWAETGTRPRATKQQQFEYGYLFEDTAEKNQTPDCHFNWEIEGKRRFKFS